MGGPRTNGAKDAEQKDLLVFISSKGFTCVDCGEEFEHGNFLTLEGPGPHCLDCADLGHLWFLPSGDTALTRRSRRASRLSAIVLKWSRARRRYERQGILVEQAAIEQAEAECLSDADARARARERAAQRRHDEDDRFVAKFADAIREQFPGCPRERALAIARHAAQRGSGRVGRTSAARALEPEPIRLAVVAAVRHLETPYDELLMEGVPRWEARDEVRDAVDEVLDAWS